MTPSTEKSMPPTPIDRLVAASRDARLASACAIAHPVGDPLHAEARAAEDRAAAAFDAAINEARDYVDALVANCDEVLRAVEAP